MKLYWSQKPETAETAETFSAVDDGGPVTDLKVAFVEAIKRFESGPDIGVAAAYRGAQFLADAAGSLEMEPVDRRTGLRSTEDVPLLHEPVDGELYQDTIQTIVLSLLFDGNAFLLPVTRSTAGDITSVHVPHPSEVNVTWNDSRTKRLYSFRDRELAYGSEVIHLSLMRKPGQERGSGPFTSARLTFESAKASEAYGASLFADDAVPPFVFTDPKSGTPAEAEEFLDAWEAAHRSRKRPGVLLDGMDIKQLSLNPVDAEFLENRRFDVQQIARLLGIPGPFLGVEMGGTMTYTNTEPLFRLFVVGTLGPTYLERIAAGFSALLPGHLKARFKTSELLTPDFAERMTGFKAGIEAGIWTPNEARREEGLPPL